MASTSFYPSQCLFPISPQSWTAIKRRRGRLGLSGQDAPVHWLLESSYGHLFLRGGQVGGKTIQLDKDRFEMAEEPAVLWLTNYLHSFSPHSAKRLLAQ